MLCHSYNSDIKIQIAPSNFVTGEALFHRFLVSFLKTGMTGYYTEIAVQEIMR